MSVVRVCEPAVTLGLQLWPTGQRAFICSYTKHLCVPVWPLRASEVSTTQKVDEKRGTEGTGDVTNVFPVSLGDETRIVNSLMCPVIARRQVYFRDLQSIVGVNPCSSSCRSSSSPSSFRHWVIEWRLFSWRHWSKAASTLHGRTSRTWRWNQPSLCQTIRLASCSDSRPDKKWKNLLRFSSTQDLLDYGNSSVLLMPSLYNRSSLCGMQTTRKPCFSKERVEAGRLHFTSSAAARPSSPLRDSCVA